MSGVEPYLLIFTSDRRHVSLRGKEWFVCAKHEQIVIISLGEEDKFIQAAPRLISRENAYGVKDIRWLSDSDD